MDASGNRKGDVRNPFFPLILILLPAIEIATFIAVGRQIGVLATLGLVFLTSMAGLTLLRVQGLGVLERLRKGMQAGESPEKPLVHGAMIVVAGLLLVIPGFITDAIGFLLFIPAVRDLAWSIAVKHAVPYGPNYGRSATRQDGKTIDLDVDDYSSNPNPSSPWLTRHED
jgi:UPF0716 protein FxsA